eukprot:Gb_03584 [translate_table: standard]
MAEEVQITNFGIEYENQSIAPHSQTHKALLIKIPCELRPSLRAPPCRHTFKDASDFAKATAFCSQWKVSILRSPIQAPPTGYFLSKILLHHLHSRATVLQAPLRNKKRRPLPRRGAVLRGIFRDIGNVLFCARKTDRMESLPAKDNTTGDGKWEEKIKSTSVSLQEEG